MPYRRHPADVEVKFNHNHDSRDGRFTSGTGGGARFAGTLRDGLRSTLPRQQASLAEIGPEQNETRGSNSRAFEDPMTLEQVFPGLRDTQGVTIISLSDNLLDISCRRTS